MRLYTFLLSIALIVPGSMLAQDDSTCLPVPPEHAESPHSYYSLGDKRELTFQLTAGTSGENSFACQFKYEPHWKRSQVFARIPALPGSYTISINQFHISTVKDGRLPLEFNITPLLRQGRNKLVIVLDSAGMVPGPFTEVSLLFRPAVQIRDIEINSHRDSDEQECLVRVQLRLRSYLERGELNRTLAMVVSDTSGQNIFRAKKQLGFPLAFGQETEVHVDFSLEDPILWGPGHPDLYTVQLHLVKNGMLRGEMLRCHFGIRDAVYEDSLLLINGDTIIPSPVSPAHLQLLPGMDSEQVLSLFEENGYNVLVAETPLPARLMNLFDRHGILVLRKSLYSAAPCFIPDRNRPSLILVD